MTTGLSAVGARDRRGASAGDAERASLAPVRLSEIFTAHRMTTVAKTPVLIAMGAFVNGGRVASPNVVAAMALASPLWAFLYAINEVNDLKCEEGRDVPARVLACLWIAVGIILAASALVGPKLLGLLLLMTLGQICYCVPPIRWKRYWWAGPLLSGTLNPIERYLCGAIWTSHPFSAVPIGIVVTLHFGASIRSRVLLRGRDAGFGYVVAPAGVEIVGALACALGLAGALYLCRLHVLPGLFLPPTVGACLFSVYAWSGRAKSVANLRRGWLLFTIFSFFYLFALYGYGGK
jgi:hypothetical protein